MSEELEFLESDHLSFAELVVQSADLEGTIGSRDVGVMMSLERVRMSMPVRLDISVDEQGQVRLSGAPPEHYVDTPFLPVFHQLELSIHSVDPTTDSP